MKGNLHSRFPVVLCLLALLLVSCGALWQTDVGRAVQMQRVGDYKEAAPVLEQAVAGGNVDPQVVQSLYFAWTRQGEYKKAVDRFETFATARAASAPIRLAAARANRITGSYARALSHLDPIQNDAALGIAAQFERAQVLNETGKGADAKVIYDKIVSDYESTQQTYRPANLIYVAGALQATEWFHDANDIYRKAFQAEPKNAEVLVAWGDMFADKFQFAQAVSCYEDALKIDPNMPEALLGLANHLDPEDPGDLEEATARAKVEARAKLFDVNPNSIGGNILAVNHFIDIEDYDKAMEAIGKVLAINPQSTEALSLVASVHFLRGEKAAFDQDVRKVLEINPQYSRLYYILGENCVSLRLYKDAVMFAREAIRLNPRDWRAHTQLGINLMRIGEQAEGKMALETSFAGDSFNPWTGNSLTLVDSFVNFDKFQTEHFQVMLHKKESAVLKPYMTELLEKAWKTLTTKYEYVPPGQVQFEVYPDHADFSVRILGLGGIGALGVSFGKVFAMDSPSARKPDAFNWGSTLWHEFAHVITLGVTDHKIPRWFSEGLSVSEERRAFPGWGDDLKPPFLAAIKATDKDKDRQFLPIADLNEGFIRPKYPQQVLVSYYQASLVVDYIEAKWGFPAIRKMLQGYKAGHETEQVFKDALNVALPQFDDEFMKWVRARVTGIDFTAFKKLITDGEEAVDAGETDKAIALFNQAILMYPEYSDEHNPYESVAAAYLKKGDKRSAIDALKKLRNWSETSYDAFILLAQLLEEAGDRAGAIEAMEAAQYDRLFDIAGHVTLGRLLLAQKRFRDAAREYEVLIALNAPDRAGAYFHLAEAYFEDGKREEARKNIRKSLEIAPTYEPAQELLLKIVR